jgi:hypothetical protein
VDETNLVVLVRVRELMEDRARRAARAEQLKVDQAQAEKARREQALRTIEDEAVAARDALNSAMSQAKVSGTQAQTTLAFLRSTKDRSRNALSQIKNAEQVVLRCRAEADAAWSIYAKARHARMRLQEADYRLRKQANSRQSAREEEALTEESSGLG